MHQNITHICLLFDKTKRLFWFVVEGLLFLVGLVLCFLVPQMAQDERPKTASEVIESPTAAVTNSPQPSARLLLRRQRLLLRNELAQHDELFILRQAAGGDNINGATSVPGHTDSTTADCNQQQRRIELWRKLFAEAEPPSPRSSLPKINKEDDATCTPAAPSPPRKKQRRER
jgi:hypothetical protein